MEILARAREQHPAGSEIRVDPCGGIWVVPAEILNEAASDRGADPALAALIETLHNQPESFWVTGSAFGPATS